MYEHLTIDEECAVPKGSDEKFVSKLTQLFDDNPNTRSPFFARGNPKFGPCAFTIRHFAGDVHYHAGNFLEKNRDALAECLLKLVKSTTSLPFLLQEPPAAAAADTSTTSSTKKGGAGNNSKYTLSTKFKPSFPNTNGFKETTIFQLI